MRRTRIVEGKRHRILASLVVFEFAVAIALLRSNPPAAVLPFVMGLAFVLFDKLGVPAVEVNANGSLYRIYPNWNFSRLILDGEERKSLSLFPGESTIELNGKELTVIVKPGGFFLRVFVEFEGERVKLF